MRTLTKTASVQRCTGQSTAQRFPPTPPSVGVRQRSGRRQRAETVRSVGVCVCVCGCFAHAPLRGTQLLLGVARVLQLLGPLGPLGPPLGLQQLRRLVHAVRGPTPSASGRLHLRFLGPLRPPLSLGLVRWCVVRPTAARCATGVVLPGRLCRILHPVGRPAPAACLRCGVSHPTVTPSAGCRLTRPSSVLPLSHTPVASIPPPPVDRNAREASATRGTSVLRPRRAD